MTINQHGKFHVSYVHVSYMPLKYLVIACIFYSVDHRYLAGIEKFTEEYYIIGKKALNCAKVLFLVHYDLF